MAEVWITAPLTAINQLYTLHPDSWEAQVESATLPSLEEIPWCSSGSPSGHLVRFQAMIQGIMDREFYTKQFLARDGSGNEMVGIGKYSDILDLPKGYELVFDDATVTKRDTRLVYYCVPVPGRNTWTRIDTEMKPVLNRVTIPGKGAKKRPLESVAEEGEEMDTTEDEKKTKVLEEEKREEVPGGFTGLNLVLPTDTGSCCVVLNYTETEFKMNEVIEVVGVLERWDDDNMVDDDDEERARFPPTSIVPRLHALQMKKLTHLNPTLPDPVSPTHPTVDAILSEAGVIRSEMINLIKECLGGDPLAAEFILLHLISHIYGRKDEVMAIGKFAVNLTNCPGKSSGFVECLSTFFSSVSEKTFVLPLTISNLNNSTLIPKKDYKSNRLVSGLLQLPLGSQVILDETVLEPGQLQPAGVENLKALGNLISWQKLTYDFGFNYNIEFECDTRVLILGEGKSLLPSDVIVPLSPMTPTPPDYPSLTSKISSHLLMEKFRKYLTVVRTIEYDDVSGDLQKLIEEDFVAERKKDRENVTGDSLHRALVVTRLFAMSRGHKMMEVADWKDAKSLERDRITRIISQGS